MKRRNHWEFLCFCFFVQKPHGCVEECCVVPPWTRVSERYVSFHQSVKKNATQSTVAS